MGKYVKSKKKMIYQSLEALNIIQTIIDDVDQALKDKSRGINDSPFGEVISGAAGIGIGGSLGFLGLYMGGITGLSASGITSGLAAAGTFFGGGMVAGIAVLAAPAVILGGAGVGVASHRKHKRLHENKELLYKKALAKQKAILKELKKENEKDKERMEYLNGLNVLLRAVIKNLQHDLGITPNNRE